MVITIKFNLNHVFKDIDWKSKRGRNYYTSRKEQKFYKHFSNKPKLSGLFSNLIFIINMGRTIKQVFAHIGIIFVLLVTINSQGCIIFNCTQCLTPTQCTQCQTGYTLAMNFCTLDSNSFPSGNGSIPSGNSTSPSGNNNITNCVNYTTDGKCSKCSNGYAVDLLGSSCIQCQFSLTSPECSNQTNSNCSVGCKICMIGFCNQCETGYQQTATSCFLCNVTNCVSCSSDNYCEFCSGFYVLTNGSCLAQTCQNGYKSIDGFCSPCDPGCSNCSTSQCSGCLDSFYSTNNMCSPCPFNCAKCTSAFSCTQSDPTSGFTFIEFSTGTAFLKCNDGCSSCNTQNWIQCLTPQRGFFISLGITLQCSPGCINCTSSGQCTECSKTSFPIVVDGKIVSCDSCDILCKTCKSKQALDNCTSCFEGFQLVNSTCLESCSHNCLTCGLAQECLSCPVNYLLTSGRCLPCIIGCKTCINLITNCSECVAGNYLILETKICQPCSSYCSACSQTGCNVCFQGYYLTSDYLCAPKCIIPCATCSPQDPTICHSCILGYNFVHAHTDKCLPHAFVSNDSKACPIGHGKASNSSCEPCKTANCLYCDGNKVATCLSCKDGFYKSQNICQSCPSTCSRCSNNESCLSCKQGYLPSVFEKEDLYLHCLPCKHPCATCKLQIHLCTSCVSGYSLHKNKCQSDYHYEIDVTLEGSVSELTQQLRAFVNSFEDITGFTNGLIIADAAQTNSSKGRLLTNSTSNSSQAVRVRGVLSSRQNSTTNLTEEEKAKLDSKFTNGSKIGNLSILNFAYKIKNGEKETLPPGTPQELPLGSQMALGIMAGIGSAIMLAVFVRICMCKLEEKKQKQIFMEMVQRTLQRQLQSSKLEHTLPSPILQGP